MQPSSGIGLSLVNELVKMLHGEIQVESEVKKGSVFKLVLHKGKEIYAQDKNVEYILNDTSEEQETVLAEPEQNDKTSLPDMPPATKETLVKVMVVRIMRSCVNLYVKYCRALTVLLELPTG